LTIAEAICPGCGASARSAATRGRRPSLVLRACCSGRARETAAGRRHRLHLRVSCTRL